MITKDNQGEQAEELSKREPATVQLSTTSIEE